jgi:membrane-associated phospholipid phosphatase
MPSLALCYAYASLMHQPAILILVLGLAGRADRLQSFVLAWAAALAITVLIFPLLPAVGGYLHYGLTPRDFPFIKVPAPFMYGKVLMAFRDGSALALDRLALEGIVAFPSFHTAAGILLAWGFWVVRWVRWPALALNGAMIASCPFVGAHYLIDIVAGGLVAWAAIILARRIDTPPRTAGSPLDFLKRLASQRAWRFAARRASRDRAYRASSPAPAR